MFEGLTCLGGSFRNNSQIILPSASFILSTASKSSWYKWLLVSSITEPLSLELSSPSKDFCDRNSGLSSLSDEFSVFLEERPLPRDLLPSGCA